MVTLSTAENALKTVYLGVVANQLNINANPLLGKIKQTSRDVWGKEIKKLAPYGVNGGVGAGSENGSLPTPAENNYLTFTTSLKNLFGQIEISDKAIRASQNNAGAFVNLLNDEMEGLIKASSFNLGRMLYGDGTGLLATASAFNSTTRAITVDSVRNLIEGMVIDTYASGSKVEARSGARITYVDRVNNAFYVNNTETYVIADAFYVQGSKNLEISGIGSLFAGETLYGINKANYPWLSALSKSVGAEISDNVIQSSIDAIELNSGSEVDFISCSLNVRRNYQKYLSFYKRNVDMVELAGGFKTMSYNGIPVVADRFVADNTMYLLNTKDFALHQLCDWKWLETEDGKILKQKAGYAAYVATLVKYADLICDRPNGQAKLHTITDSVTNPYDSIVTAIGETVPAGV